MTNRESEGVTEIEETVAQAEGSMIVKSTGKAGSAVREGTIKGFTSQAPLELSNGNGWTLFIDNLSRRVSRLTLKELIGHYGRVIRVFIPAITRRSKYKDSTFAFVTMACRDDMMRVVAKLDKSIIDGKQIRVSKERFPRDRVGGVSSLRKAQSSGLTKSVHWQPAIKKSNVTDNVAHGVNVGASNKKTYRDALLSNSANLGVDVGVALDKSVVNVKVLNDGDNFTSLNIPVAKNAWLKCCLVGILKNLFEVGFVQQAFLHEGIDARLVPPLLINDIPHQFCYVNLAGVPLTCWHSDFFSSVGKQWGSFVDIEENTRTRARLDVACVILRVASPLTIPDFLMVEAMGFKFRINISLRFKEVVDYVPGNGEVEENFADVWPENHFEQDLVGEQIGVEVQNNCSSLGVGPVAEFSRNNTFHIPTMNGINGDTLTKNLASPRIVFNNDSNIGSGLHDKLVQEKDNLMFVPVSGVGLTGQAFGLSSPILVDSVPIYNNPIILCADRPSLDSLDGVGSFVGGVNIEVVGSRFQCNSGSSAHLPQQGLLKACIRRRVRRHVRDSLEGIQSLGGKSFIPLSSDKNFTAEELEAEAVWDISNLLDIAFKGGKEAVETKVEGLKSGWLRRLWNLPSIEYVCSPAVGSAGGLLSLWDSDFFKVIDKFVAPKYVALIGVIQSINLKCGLVNVYGPSIDSEKKCLLIRVSSLLEILANPMVYWGDFNMFLCLEEKMGLTLNNSLIDLFKAFVFDVGFIDLPLQGRFTWCNNRDPPTFVRLDRFLISTDFESAFPWVNQLLLGKSISDHNAIILSETRIDWGPKPFKCFNFWFGDEGFGEIHCTTGKEISVLESRIQSEGNVQDLLTRLGELRAGLWMEFRREESSWLQKSRLRWFSEGDQNTRFFHISASTRRRCNSINRLKNGDALLSDPILIKAHVFDYFYQAYNSKHALEVEELNLNFKQIGDSQASFIQREFSEGEVWEALSSADSNRAPGPDGFNLEDFRPISLVGGMYKLLSKVLTRRLRSCIGQVIGDSQFAFIAGRQILDCSLIANEAIDYMFKTDKSGVAFKIDFQKAYDTVSWDFLIMVMRMCGFGEKWCGWVLQCISTVKISVLVNGVPTESFPISRGLRQGCSLSPLLFNLVGEALNQMLVKAVNLGLFSGFSIGRGETGINLSLLQFADDLLIFCGASECQVRNVKRVLRIFELASGLKLNLKKSKILGVNVDEDTLKTWAFAVGCVVDSFPSSYLGLPLGANRNSVVIWEPVVSNFSKKLEGWKSKLLSYGGRLTLIKSILTSLPGYFLSLFRMPASVANRLNMLMSNFMWGGNSDKSRIHWVRWDHLCKPARLGGLGIANLDLLNRALLDKWFCRYGNESASLWRRVIASKISRSESALLPVPGCGRNTSWIWKGILKSACCEDSFGLCFRANLSVQVGDGIHILFWDDVWLGNSSLKDQFPRFYALSCNKSGKVADFGRKIGARWVWHIPLRRGLFDRELPYWQEFMSRLNTFQSSVSGHDWVQWLGSSDDSFSVKSLKKLVIGPLPPSNFWVDFVWIGFAPPKVELFVWLVMLERISVKVELAKRGVNLSGSWVKAKFGECSLSLDCIVNDPFVVTNLCLLPRPLASAQSWSPPPHGFAKLNVDGALSSSREAGGLGGLFRDENGRTLFQFSESCGSGPAALIELQAVKLGMDLFLRSDWSTKLRLVLESDCKLVTDWLLRVSVPPFCFVCMVEDMVHTISSRGILVHWVPRCCNSTADSLAKAVIPFSLSISHIEVISYSDPGDTMFQFGL
ncbi:hypothetical protein GQ457_16G011680 [Hibiscus cannabinus]